MMTTIANDDTNNAGDVSCSLMKTRNDDENEDSDEFKDDAVLCR